MLIIKIAECNTCHLFSQQKQGTSIRYYLFLIYYNDIKVIHILILFLQKHCGLKESTSTIYFMAIYPFVCSPHIHVTITPALKMCCP